MVVATETGRAWAILHAIDHGAMPARSKPTKSTEEGTFVLIGTIKGIRWEATGGNPPIVLKGTGKLFRSV